MILSHHLKVKSHLSLFMGTGFGDMSLLSFASFGNFAEVAWHCTYIQGSIKPVHVPDENTISMCPVATSLAINSALKFNGKIHRHWLFTSGLGARLFMARSFPWVASLSDHGEL